MKQSKKNTNPWMVVIGVFVFILLLYCIQTIRSSLFFHKYDRIQILIYGKKPVLYSLDGQNVAHYQISYSPDLRVVVPGSYGEYRIGALGKLAYLENKPAIIQRTFSSIQNSMVHFYFYENSDEIYYEENKEASNNSSKSLIKDIFFMKSNANFADRIYLGLLTLGIRKQNIRDLSRAVVSNTDKSNLLQTKEFYESIEGYFYSRLYRDEQRTIQIMYPASYAAASLIGNIIEGSGARVVDLSKSKDKGNKACIIIDSSPKITQTAKDIGLFFRCKVMVGSTTVSDIIMELGDTELLWNK